MTIGNQTMTIGGQDEDFIWSNSDEPHAKRRHEILAKYPEIKQLFGHDPNLKYVVLGVVALQCFCAYAVQHASWPVYIATSYIVGATCNHMMMMAMHELSHNLGFKKFWHNRVFSLFANLPVGVPSAITFRRYHLIHHKHQGEDGVDVDLPTSLEGRLIQSTLAKFLFVCFQSVFYSVRPGLVNPQTPEAWELVNWATQVTFDAAIFSFMGPSALGYLILSTFFGMGLHPVAGHFIAEHYVFDNDEKNGATETYSYYGFFNLFTFNVGYHNEHHDFPFVAGSRLPKLRAIASEYYDKMPQHACWIMVMYNFITDPNMTAFCRVKRHSPSSSSEHTAITKKPKTG